MIAGFSAASCLDFCFVCVLQFCLKKGKKKTKHVTITQRKAHRIRIRTEDSPPLVLGGPSDKSPVNADGLTHHILTIEPFHCCLGLFVGLILHQCIALRLLINEIIHEEKCPL